MTADSVFWIASMTKAVTSAAAMQLVEQGKLSLDEPIASCCRISLRRRCWKALTPMASQKLRPAKKPITLRQLMTHTAGFAYDMWNGDMVQYLAKTGTPGIISLPECRAEDAADDRSRHALGIRHQYRFRGPGRRSRQRQAARRISARQHVGAARHERHRLQTRPFARQRLVGMHARGEDGSLRDPVRAGAESGIHMGGRRPLRHRRRLYQVHPDDPQQRQRQTATSS